MLGHLRRQVDVERVADHRRRFEQPPRVRSQPAQLRRQRGRDRRRHGPVAARGNSVSPARPHELLEVERVAAAVGVDGVGARADQLARLHRAQRPHPDHRRALERELAGAGREREQDAARRRPVDQRQQRLARGGVGPVHVVEADDQRPAQPPAPPAASAANGASRGGRRRRAARPAPRSTGRRAGRPRTPTRAPPARWPPRTRPRATPAAATSRSRAPLRARPRRSPRPEEGLLLARAADEGHGRILSGYVVPPMTGAPRHGTLPSMKSEPIHPAVRVGHVHLKVADLDRSLAFYRDALGLNLTADGRPAGLDAAFLAAGDYHHHIGINTWESAGATPPPPGHTGLYHVAFVYPDRRELGKAVQRLLDHGISRTTPRTTAARSRSTWTTPTATASSSTTTARATPGSTTRAGRSSRPIASPCRTSSARPLPQPPPQGVSPCTHR